MGLLHFLLGMRPTPLTVVISFNYFLEHNLPPSVAYYMCGLFSEFDALGARVIVSSGDNGVGAEDCETF